MKNKVLVIAISIIALFAFNTAQAQNAHFTDIVVSEDGLTVTGKVAGLGNKFAGKDIVISYSTEVSVTNVCYNPGNGDIVPGHSGATSVLEAGQPFKIIAKNGQVTFSLKLDSTQVPTTGTCPPGLIQGESSAIATGVKKLSFSIDGTNVTGNFTL